MTKPFVVQFNRQPLTVPIEDEKRVALAYSVLYSIAEDGATIKVNDETTSMYEDELFIVDADGNSYTPDLCCAWNMSGAQYMDMMDKLAGDDMEEVIQSGVEPRFAHLHVHVPEYHVYSFDESGREVLPVPSTFFKDEAVEICNFMRYGFNPSVSLSIQDGRASLPGDLVQVGAFDVNGHLVPIDIQDNPEWAKGFMAESSADDFTILNKKGDQIMTLNVTVKSGISADGFDTVVKDGDTVVDKQSWNYGYNCSWNKDTANEQRPYVTDVLQDLCNKYNIAEITVDAGKNVFAKKDVSSDMVSDFIKDYCSDLQLPGADQDFAAAVADIPVAGEQMQQ